MQEISKKIFFFILYASDKVKKKIFCIKFEF